MKSFRGISSKLTRQTGARGYSGRYKSKVRHPAPWPGRRSSLSIAVAAVLAGGFSVTADAATVTWTGGGSNSNWSTSANWNPPPAGVSQNDSLVFNNTVKLVQVVNPIFVGSTKFSVSNISFGVSAGAFTFNAAATPVTLNVNGNITNASGRMQTFNTPVQASGTVTWDGGLLNILSPQGLTFANAWLGDAGNNALTLQGSVVMNNPTARLLGGGAGDLSTLNIKGGSFVNLTSLTLANEFGSQGTILVDGSFSRLTTTGDLIVGQGSTGTITVQNSGTLTSVNSVIGKSMGSDGLVTVSGAISSWENTGSLSVGDAAFGSLRVEAGGKVTSAAATLGNLADSAGTAKVTGANSNWKLTGNLQLGNLGEGTLFIEQGGLVNGQSFIVGTVGDAGTSLVQITGAGSRLQASGDLTVNSGSLAISAGGLASAKTASFGNLGSSSALVNVGGGGATLTAIDNLIIGSDTGTATVNLATGGTINSGAQLVIGKGGVLNLNGGTLNTGWSSSAGQVNFNSGTVNFLGSQATGTGILDHSTGLGAGMNITVASELIINVGDGIALNGGQAQAQTVSVLGELSVGSFSQLSVGTGGLNNSGFLQLAAGTLSSAGNIVSSNYLIGHGVIAGAGSFTNTGLLRQTGGTLELATKGSNSNTGNWELLDGRGLVLSGADLYNYGVMSLSGDTVSGSAWLINALAGTMTGRGVISAKFGNDGRLTVDAGSLRIDKSFINGGQILLGSTTATMAGGDITNTGRIVGAGQVNNLIINTGTVSAVGGTLTLDRLTNNGIVTAGTGATLLLMRGLASNPGKIQLAGGAVDTNGYAMTNEVGGVINGYGSLSGGLLTNKGKMLLSGGTSTIYNDVLATNASQIILSGNSNTTLYGNIDVQSGAELRVSTGSVATFFGNVQQRTGAKFTGAGAKRFEGTLTVGASPGMGTDEGDVEFGDSSTYLAEIGGITACSMRCENDEAFKNSSYDKYIVAGSLSLNGTLKLASWNGFVAQAGQSFDLLDWGTLTGTFAQIDASGLTLAAGTQLDYSKLYTNGSISVTAAAVPEPHTWALMLAGMSAVASLARRRRVGQMSA